MENTNSQLLKEVGCESRNFSKAEDGSAFVEYVILTGLFSLLIAGAMMALGEPLLHFFRHAQLVWSGPFP